MSDDEAAAHQHSTTEELVKMYSRPESSHRQKLEDERVHAKMEC